MKNDHFETRAINRMCSLQRAYRAALNDEDAKAAILFSAKYDGFVEALSMVLSGSFLADLTRRANEQLANEETNRTTRKEDT